MQELLFGKRQLTDASWPPCPLTPPTPPHAPALQLTDADAPRWEVPRWLLRASELLPAGDARGSSRRGGLGGSSREGGQRLSLAVREEPFSLEVTRPAGDGGATLLNTTGTRLVYKASRAVGAHESAVEGGQPLGRLVPAAAVEGRG